MPCKVITYMLPTESPRTSCVGVCEGGGCARTTRGVARIPCRASKLRGSRRVLVCRESAPVRWVWFCVGGGVVHVIWCVGVRFLFPHFFVLLCFSAYLLSRVSVEDDNCSKVARGDDVIAEVSWAGGAQGPRESLLVASRDRQCHLCAVVWCVCVGGCGSVKIPGCSQRACSACRRLF